MLHFPLKDGDGGPYCGGSPAWVQQLQELLKPCARCTFQDLINLTIDLYNAIAACDLCTATDVLKSGFNLVRKLIPRITNLPNVYQAYCDILIVNFKLNKQLACGEADIDDIVAFLDSNGKILSDAVCKDSANQHQID